MIYTYGYKEEEILELTLPQFRARLQDAFEIPLMFQGEGKGRITRERQEVTRERIAGKGVRPPKFIR